MYDSITDFFFRKIRSTGIFFFYSDLHEKKNGRLARAQTGRSLEYEIQTKKLAVRNTETRVFS